MNKKYSFQKMNISGLPVDMLVKLSFDLDLPDVINLCKTSKKFNQSICKNQNFWLNKLLIDYPDYKIFHVKGTNFEIYKTFYEYSLPKRYQKYKTYNLLDLYRSVKLGLNTKEEFENFVSQIFPFDYLIVDHEGTSLIDYVRKAESYIYGDFSSQVVIVFDYNIQKVTYTTSNNYGRYKDNYLLLWTK